MPDNLSVHFRALGRIKKHRNRVCCIIARANHDDAHTNKTEEDENVKNRPLINCFVEDGKLKDDFFGNLTICNVPDSLLREFMRTVVWPKFPGGVSEALQGLMRKEVEKQKKLDAF